MSVERDKIYANPIGKISDFTFDEAVVKVFPNMIERSVPGYSTIISAIGLLAQRFAQPNSVCYDLGCSLGAAALSMRHHIKAPNCKIIAIDNSEAMINQFSVLLAQDTSLVPVQLQCANIGEVAIEKASVVVLNFTMQFIPVAERLPLLKTIYNGMLPGGVLIVSEKLSFEDVRQQTLQSELHHEFKKAQGYSAMEISQKRDAIENVLIPETAHTHLKRFTHAGFSSAEIWFAYFNFASFIALK